jgi:transposase
VADPGSIRYCPASVDRHDVKRSGRSNPAEAIHYALRHWPGLVLFLDDGRIEPDTNSVERAIRPIPLRRRGASLD